MRSDLKEVAMKSLATLIVIFGLVLMVLSAGCSSNGGGDDGGPGSESDDGGDVFIDMTDGLGDIQRYAVDVISIKLTRATGEEVETLPMTTRIDFAQYAEMTEFVTACTVPSGTYVKASMVLDYSDTDIRVENEDGDLVRVSPDNIRDEDGARITTMSVSIQLDELNSLIIKPGIPAHLSLDFDLKASNAVEWQGEIPVVTVSPVFLADIEPHPWKANRLRGPLAKVQTHAGWFDVMIRPFSHAIDKADMHSRFGTARVYTDRETLFLINGEYFQGDEGLERLDGLEEYAAVQAFGRFIKETGWLKFAAREVIAGSSLPGGSSDVVAGNVIARSGDTVTLRGATLVRDDGTVIFHNTVDVDLSDALAGRQYKKGRADIDDISVGQRLLVFGKLDDSGVSMDAVYAHMYLTSVAGTANSASSKHVNMELQSIDGRDISIFDFGGTYSDPLDYRVDTGPLDISGIVAGTVLKAYGFPVGFGLAKTLPEDFTAFTLINVSNTKGIMSIGWGKYGSPDAIGFITEGLRLNLINAGPLHHMFRAGVSTDLAGLAPAIIPEGGGVYCISHADVFKVFSKYEKFSAELQEMLGAGARVRHLFAGGLYSDAQETLTGRLIVVRLK